MRGYVRDFRPVLVAVDGGADALIEEGWTPDVIVGDMDSVTDATLRCGAEILVHAYREELRPRRAAATPSRRPLPHGRRAGDLRGHRASARPRQGRADRRRRGPHFNLVEFLERSRAGMSSTFVTRLKVGEILVDAKGVSRLISRRVGV